jgi:hypothetical protein
MTIETARSKVTPELLEALDVVLTEFGECDLPERLKYFREEGEDDLADQLESAFNLVGKWHDSATAKTDIDELLSDPKHPDWEKIITAYRSPAE